MARGREDAAANAAGHIAIAWTPFSAAGVIPDLGEAGEELPVKFRVPGHRIEVRIVHGI
mgnify:CR=1 FL=1